MAAIKTKANRPEFYARRNPTPAAEGPSRWATADPVLDHVEGFFAAGWPIVALSKHLGVSRGTLDHWRRNPPAKIHENLAKRVLSSELEGPPEGTTIVRQWVDVQEDLDFLLDTGENALEAVASRLGYTATGLAELLDRHSEYAYPDGIRIQRTENWERA